MSNRQIHSYKRIFDERSDEEQLIVEGKHWPEDYKKTAYNAIKAS